MALGRQSIIVLIDSGRQPKSGYRPVAL